MDDFLPSNDIDATWQTLQRSAAIADLAAIQVVDVLGLNSFVADGTDAVGFDEGRDGKALALRHVKLEFGALIVRRGTVSDDFPACYIES